MSVFPCAPNLLLAGSSCCYQQTLILSRSQHRWTNAKNASHLIVCAAQHGC